MSFPIITVENLGKKYRLNHQAQPQRYTALRDVISEKAKRLFRFPMNRLPALGAKSYVQAEDFWALRDVSFEVRQGEVVGFIGRNGAGKSTLLKILSRITEPTTGRVRLRGRVASLLEVGTGFHPELTGRENIYLNGAILGMTRVEIKRRFDEIVAFAEVDQFLDTPIKRYSSGMYVRLAFAVAAHLEPEVLIVDEVLAVGDGEFQKKCLGKMESVARSEGRTVLFVSHQLAAVQNLCNRGIHLAGGRIVNIGDIGSVIAGYAAAGDNAELSFADRTDRQGNGLLRFESLSLADMQGVPVRSLTCGAPALLKIFVSNEAGRDLKNLRVAIGIDSHLGERLSLLSTHISQEDFAWAPEDISQITAFIPKLSLLPGRYGFALFASVNGVVTDWIKNAGSFDIEPGDYFGTGQLPEHGKGFMLMEHSFEFVASPRTCAV